MDTEEASIPEDTAASSELVEDEKANNDAKLPKREASPSEEDANTKRQKHRGGNGHVPPPNDRLPNDRPSDDSNHVHERRLSAAQEEKKRGRRLFGGLLSTLSQTNTNSQHKRRQEIERRQQERLQKQRDEDDQKRAERLSRIKEERMIEQIDFEQQVMKARHSKMLSLAQFLKTKAEPPIYYLPWKLTAEQEDRIEEQIRTAKSIIAREEPEFQTKKERHHIRYGSRRASAQHQHHHDGETLAEPSNAENANKEEEMPREAAERNGSSEKDKSEGLVKDEAQLERPAAHHDPHDESGDVLVEADEDMVIY